jgi:hypothetical protein
MAKRSLLLAQRCSSSLVFTLRRDPGVRSLFALTVYQAFLGGVRSLFAPVRGDCQTRLLVSSWLNREQRSLYFALVATLAPTMHDSGQESQINLILILQIDASRLRLTPHIFDPGSFAFACWIRTGNSQHGPKQFIVMCIQVVTNPAIIQTKSRPLDQTL